MRRVLLGPDRSRSGLPKSTGCSSTPCFNRESGQLLSMMVMLSSSGTIFGASFSSSKNIDGHYLHHHATSYDLFDYVGDKKVRSILYIWLNVLFGPRRQNRLSTRKKTPRGSMGGKKGLFSHSGQSSFRRQDKPSQLASLR